MRTSVLSRKRLAIAAAVAVVPATLLLNTSTATGSDNAMTIRLVEKDATFKFIDVGVMQGEQHPPTVGDMFVITAQLFRGGNHVGMLVAKCTFTTMEQNPDDDWILCDGAYQLPGGFITGTTLTRAGGTTTEIAITGGTGKYAGVSGTSTERPGPNDTTIATLHLMK